MLLLQPILDCVHFVQTTVFYVWLISLHLGRGTFLLIKGILSVLQDVYKGFIILGEELFRFFAELNSSIDAAASYIGNSANRGINSALDGIIVFFRSFSSFFSTSKLHTRLLSSKLGSAVTNFCSLLYGSIILIADTIWWLITLVPRTIINLIVATADFLIFSFNAAGKAVLYTLQTLINDIFRITISLFVLYLIWKKRLHISLMLARCYNKIKMFFRMLFIRWRNYFNPRSGHLTLPPMRRSPISRSNRTAHGNEPKSLHQQVCVICRDAPKSVLLWPCRHLCLCEECADRIEASHQATSTCPLCRGQIESFVSIYT